MHKEYIRGNHDGISRSVSSKRAQTELNPELRERLLELCIRQACEFYSEFLNLESKPPDYDELVHEYELEYKHARSIGLLKPGGAREKDHLNFWCLGRILAPELYVESGVSSGSSLHAFLRVPGVSRLIAIDPNLKKLKINTEDFPALRLIDEQDFGQCEIPGIPDNSLVYFDDHSNSAQRVIEAYEKGFKYLLFDDSNGMEGICQRYYPSVPSVPMILNWEAFRNSDTITWTIATYHKSPFRLLNKINAVIGRQKGTWNQLQFKIDEEMLRQCREARDCIKRYTKILDLGEYLPQNYPEKTRDKSKHLVQLNLK